MVDVLHTIAKQLLDRNENRVSVKKPVKIADDDAAIPIKSAALMEEPEREAFLAETELEAEDEVENNKDKTKEVDEQTVMENRTLEESCEGKEKVEKEDYLLSQIDEFRAKAQILQDLLISKEKKAAELQSIVDEREGKAKELEEIVAERKKRADGIAEELAEEMAKEVTTVLASQIDEIIGNVLEKMEEFQTAVSMDLNAEQKLTEHQYIKIKEELDEILPELNTQLDSLKMDLSEKVHSENVKCYRNVSDLIKVVEDKLDILKSTEYKIEQKIKLQQKYTIVLLALGAINLAGVAVLLLFSAT